MSGVFLLWRQTGKWREGNGDILREQQEWEMAGLERGGDVIGFCLKWSNIMKVAGRKHCRVSLIFPSMSPPQRLMDGQPEGVGERVGINLSRWWTPWFDSPSKNDPKKSGSNESSRNPFFPSFRCVIPGIERRIHGWCWLNSLYNTFISLNCSFRLFFVVVALFLLMVLYF